MPCITSFLTARSNYTLEKLRRILDDYFVALMRVRFRESPMSVTYEPGRKKLRSCTIEDLLGTSHTIRFRDSLVESDLRKSQETGMTIELPCRYVPCSSLRFRPLDLATRPLVRYTDATSYIWSSYQ